MPKTNVDKKNSNIPKYVEHKDKQLDLLQNNSKLQQFEIVKTCVPKPHEKLTIPP